MNVRNPKAFLFSYDDLLTFTKEILKGALSGPGKLLTTESLFKMMKNAFYFILIALFILKIFRYCLGFLVM